jgi:hypothetical protein
MPLIPGTSYLATFILSMRDETQRDVARSVSKTIEDSGSTELAEVLPDVASRLARHSFPACPTKPP